MNRLLATYAMDFTSYLFQLLKDDEINIIKQVILFGSVARGDADRKSDVDLFIITHSKTETIEKKANRATETFYQTERYHQWKLLGVNNRFHCIVGNLDEWKDLKLSIIANGIVLYGKYTAKTEGKTVVLFTWEKVRPEAKRVLLSKKLFGYTYKGKRYEGIAKAAGAKKFGNACIMVPLEAADVVKLVFKDTDIQAKLWYMSLLE